MSTKIICCKNTQKKMNNWTLSLKSVCMCCCLIFQSAGNWPVATLGNQHRSLLEPWSLCKVIIEKWPRPSLTEYIDIHTFKRVISHPWIHVIIQHKKKPKTNILKQLYLSVKTWSAPHHMLSHYLYSLQLHLVEMRHAEWKIWET